MRKSCKYVVENLRGAPGADVKRFASPSAAKAHAKKFASAIIYKVCTPKSGRTIAAAYNCTRGRCKRAAKRTKRKVSSPYVKF